MAIDCSEYITFNIQLLVSSCRNFQEKNSIFRTTSFLPLQTTLDLGRFQVTNSPAKEFFSFYISKLKLFFEFDFI